MGAGGKHRGRWQAQGAGLEKSEAWAQPLPLAASEGKLLSTRLETKPSASERATRLDCFRRALDVVDRAAGIGGIEATYIGSFAAFAVTSGRRVDVEIPMGNAFAP